MSLLVKSKHQTFEKFREWKKLVKTQIEKKVNCLRIDNELEFCNEAFTSFYRENGIIRHKTVPEYPYQNGLSERMNRTFIESVIYMLIDANMPKIILRGSYCYG